MIYIGSGVTDAEKPFALYDNLLSGGVLTGSAGLAAGAAYENVFGPQTYDFWQPTTLAGEWICTLPAALDMDCIAFAAHNLPATGGNFNVQWSPDLVTAFSTIKNFAPAEIAANGLASIGAIFTTQAVRRLRFYCWSNSIAPQIGIAYAGKRLVFPGWVQSPYVQATDAETLDLQTASTLGGHYIDGSVRRKALTQDVQFSPLDRSFVDGGLRTFGKHYNSGKPFFWGGSPLNMPGDVGYVWRSGGELRPALMDGGKYASVKMGLAGYDA